MALIFYSMTPMALAFVRSRSWVTVSTVYRLMGLCLVLAAIGYQLSTQIRDDASIVNFFSFFTILSNIFSAIVLALMVFWKDKQPAWLESLRGATTLYMAITGVVFATLLSDLTEELQVTEPWVNTVLHQVMPIFMVADWLIDPPRKFITANDALRWLVVPIVWTVYTLIRGPIADWYPYPFIDPRENGYAAVTLTCVVIAAGFVGIAFLLRWIGNRLGQPRTYKPGQ